VVDILDIIHVAGYLWKAAKAFHKHKEHQEAFVEERSAAHLAWRSVGVITGMRRMASQRNLKGEALKAVTTACNYYEKNAERMHYDEYLKAGYPIASGVIEEPAGTSSRIAWRTAGCAGRCWEPRRC